MFSVAFQTAIATAVNVVVANFSGWSNYFAAIDNS